MKVRYGEDMANRSDAWRRFQDSQTDDQEKDACNADRDSGNIDAATP